MLNRKKMRGNITRATLSTWRALFLKSMFFKMGIIGDGVVWKQKQNIIFIICLLVWGFSSHSRIFHSYGNVTITGEGLQILTYARHLWPLSSETSLACQTGQPFIIVIFEDRDTQTYCLAFGSRAVTTCFNDLGLSRLVFEHPTFCLPGERSNRLRHRRGLYYIKLGHE